MFVPRVPAGRQSRAGGDHAVRRFTRKKVRLRRSAMGFMCGDRSSDAGGKLGCSRRLR